MHNYLFFKKLQTHGKVWQILDRKGLSEEENKHRVPKGAGWGIGYGIGIPIGIVINIILDNIAVGLAFCFILALWLLTRDLKKP